MKKEKYLVVSLGKDKEAIDMAINLRNKNKIVSEFYGKPSKALAYANSYKINKVIFVGEKEVASGKFKVKDMVMGEDFEIILIEEDFEILFKGVE